MTRWLARSLLAVTALVGSGGSPAWGVDDTGAIVVTDPRVVESSGLAVSPDDPSLLYTVNDAGNEPLVYVIDRTDGSVVGTTSLVGVDPDESDPEALAVDGDGTLWVGDVGDNLRQRDDVALYALPAPGPGDHAVTPARYPLRYRDGPADVETLLAHPTTGQLWVVTKDVLGQAVLALPDPPSRAARNVLETIDADVPAVVTDGTLLPDGSGVVLRTYSRAYVYRLPDWELVTELALPRQQQGESLTVLPDGRTLLAGSEGSPARIDVVELPAGAWRQLHAGEPDEPDPGASSPATGSSDETDAKATTSDAGMSGGAWLAIGLGAAVLVAGGGLLALRLSPTARPPSRRSR